MIAFKAEALSQPELSRQVSGFLHCLQPETNHGGATSTWSFLPNMDSSNRQSPLRTSTETLSEALSTQSCFNLLFSSDFRSGSWSEVFFYLILLLPPVSFTDIPSKERLALPTSSILKDQNLPELVLITV